MISRPTKFRQGKQRAALLSVVKGVVVLCALIVVYFALSSSGLVSEPILVSDFSPPIAGGTSSINISTDGGRSWKEHRLTSEAGTKLDAAEFTVGPDYVAYYDRVDDALRYFTLDGRIESVDLGNIHQGTNVLGVDSIVAHTDYVLLNVGSAAETPSCARIGINDKTAQTLSGIACAKWYQDAQNSATQSADGTITIAQGGTSATYPSASFGSWDYDPINKVLCFEAKGGSISLVVDGTKKSVELPRSRSVHQILLDASEKVARIACTKKLPLMGVHPVYQLDYAGNMTGLRASAGFPLSRTYILSPNLMNLIQQHFP